MYGGSGLYSKRREVENKRKIWLYFFLGIFSAAGILAGLWSGPRYPELLISNINVSGNNAVKEGLIKNSVANNITGVFYIFFPKNNSLWFPKETIEETLLKDYPRLATASVGLKDLKNIEVRVTEREAKDLYCKGEKENPTNCYFVDNRGFIFAEAPSFTGSVYKRFFSTTTEFVIGQQVMLRPDFEAITQFSDALSKNGLNVNSVFMDKDSLKLGLEDGGEIILSNASGANSALDNLLILLKSNDFKGRSGDGKLKFQYIDLRFGNKVYYKI